MFENMTDKLMAGILVGLVIWLVTNAVSFLLQRYRLEKAFIEDIKHRRSNLDDTKDYLETCFKDYIKDGKILDYHAHFTRQEFPFYEDMRKELFKYLGSKNLVALMRCYEAFGEVEILTEGIIKDFREYAEKKKVLSTDDVSYLSRKKDRILKVIDILEQGELRRFSDIPRDYKGMMSAVDIIRK
jgi:hypothetical protein